MMELQPTFLITSPPVLTHESALSPVSMINGAAAQNTSVGGVCLSSGTRTNQMTTGQTFPVNDPSTSYVLAFRLLSNCTGTLGGTMSGANFYIQLEWKEMRERWD